MTFRGLTSFRTHDPKLLGVDLEREHNAVAEALRQVELQKASRWTTWRKVTGNATANLDEAVLVDTTAGALTIKLPIATSADVGKAVLVCHQTGAGSITIVPTTGTVQFTDFDTMNAPGGRGYRIYIWDGQSGWWRTYG